ncbi:hypothetical protein ACUN9Y_14170 [Halomonas sp. V046]|uniref:hypothetical protein n=1 Tax=Halomonas sp. V046 TaxID=3459611 RepID=UPI00404515BE
MTHQAWQKLKLIALIAIFLLPMAVAWGMVQWGVGIPEGRTAHGDLDLVLPELDDWPLERSGEVGPDDWVMVYACQAGCEQDADRWWRLHRALGKDAHRISRIRIGGQDKALPGERLAHWRGEAPKWQAGRALWIADPEGRIALAYPAQVETAAVLDDIEKLLKMNPESPMTPLRDEGEGGRGDV